MEVLVVGAGEMGRWFARAVQTDVAFADVDESAAADAAADLGRRGRAVGLDDEVSVGVVCIAVPMPAVGEAVERHAGKAQQAVVDVTGSMRAPLAAMAAAATNRERVSFHPLFAADAAPGRIAVSTGAPGPATDRIREWLADAGNDLVDVDPETHDDAMRTVQGRAHAAILAFALAADDVPAGLETPVYADLRRLADRVTDGTPRVYGDVQDQFGGAEDVAAALESLASGDRTAFREAFEDAGG